jgi:hypothetical protein
MSQYKNKWEPSSTRWWVRCTKETAVMMERLDDTRDAHLEKTPEAQQARALWSAFAGLVHDCFNNGSNRWQYLQGARAREFRAIAAHLKGVPEELDAFLETADEEVRKRAPGELHVPTRTPLPGGVDDAYQKRALLGARGWGPKRPRATPRRRAGAPRSAARGCARHTALQTSPGRSARRACPDASPR